ncbi:hypothetical protein REPUB_Repub02eG0126900 [Reevesia pubescens]
MHFQTKVERRRESKCGRECVCDFSKETSPKMQGSRYIYNPCVIGSTRFERAMLDLDASINVMPYSIYAYLNLGHLKKKNCVIIQLADRSNAYLKEVV